MVEVVGKAFKVPFEQIGFIAVKVGIVGVAVVTVIVNVVVVAHCPAVGVKV